jgi:Ca2+-transporting ATPase
MNYAVGVSLILTLSVIYIPGVNKIFDNVALAPTAWLVILPLAIIPFAASEIFKLVTSKDEDGNGMPDIFEK